MSDERDDLRLRVHEAAHAWVRWWYGWGIGAVSVRRCAAHSGVVIGDGSGPGPFYLGPHPLDDLDGDQRRLAERWLVAIVAGEEAADLFAPRLGRSAEPDEALRPRHAAGDGPRAAEAAAALPAAVHADLLASESDVDGLDDREQAADLAVRLVGMTAGAFLTWIRSEARELARAHAPAIGALAAALADQPIIGGPQAVAIFEQAEREAA